MKETLDGWTLGNYQKRQIAKTMTLRDGVSIARVLAKIEKQCRKFLIEYHAHETRYKNPRVKEVRGREVIYLDRRRHKSKGHPPKPVTRSLVKALVPICEDATGKQLGRINVSGWTLFQGRKTLATHRWKRIPFLAACMRAVGIGYPSRIIQEVLEELHHSPSRRPSRP